MATSNKDRGGRAALWSFLLAMATLSLWVRSYFVCDDFRWNRLSGSYKGVESAVGGIYFFWGRERPGPRSRVEYFTWHSNAWEEGYGVTPRRWAGVQAFRVPIDGEIGPRTVIVVSHWLVFAGLLLPPAAWAVRARRRRRREAAGRCLECGFDLRASRRRCPECGAGIPRKGRWWERITQRGL
jgi:hypothetical protein